MLKSLAPAIAALLSIGCGSPEAPTGQDFVPTPVAPGYTRYTLPDVRNIKPGSDIMQCQWLMEPQDHDRYVTVITGQQTKGGHHIVLYSNKKIEPVGTTRDCGVDDMLQIGFIGAYGGEGNSTGEGQVPDGVAFKLPKGYALMSNTHFLNATQESLTGKGVVDVKWVDVSAAKYIADLFANLNMDFMLPAGKASSAQAKCVFPKDVSFFRMANHLHEWGKSATTEVIRAADGKREMITMDTAWQKEMTFNFPFKQWPIEQPLTIHKGDTLVTTCNWMNTENHSLAFPTEMCVVFGFYVPGTGAQVTCQNGEWFGGP